jgi:hypothetical protein
LPLTAIEQKIPGSREARTRCSAAPMLEFEESNDNFEISKVKAANTQPTPKATSALFLAAITALLQSSVDDSPHAQS